jgi:hypothetical protein
MDGNKFKAEKDESIDNSKDDGKNSKCIRPIMINYLFSQEKEKKQERPRGKELLL